MDLSTVLADGTDGLGNPALARYYRGIFTTYLPSDLYPGSFRVRVCLHFGVQQLATRSRVSPERERFLQIGGFDAHDLPAALIEAMPHTMVACRDLPEGTQDALAALQARLPPDAMPGKRDADKAPGCFGLVAVFATGAAPDLDTSRPLLNPLGRILLIHRLTPEAPPVLTLHA